MLLWVFFYRSNIRVAHGISRMPTLGPQNESNGHAGLSSLRVSLLRSRQRLKGRHLCLVHLLFRCLLWMLEGEKGRARTFQIQRRVREGTSRRLLRLSPNGTMTIKVGGCLFCTFSRVLYKYMRRIGLFQSLLAQHGDDFKRIAASMPNKVCLFAFASELGC